MNLAKRFIQNQSGGFAIIFALSSVVLIFVTGMAIDYARFARTKNVLQQTFDSAVLAQIKDFRKNRNQDSAWEEARSIVHTNEQAKDFYIIYNINEVKEDNGVLSVDMSGYVELNKTLTGVLLPKYTKISADASVSMPLTNTTITVVPDVSSSMQNSGRMSALVSALEDFSEIIYGSENKTDEYLRVNLVPFAGNVNLQRYSSSAESLMTGWNYKPDTSVSWKRHKHYLPTKKKQNEVRHRVEIVKDGSNNPYEVVWEETYNRKDGWTNSKLISDKREISGCLQAANSEFKSDKMLSASSSKVFPKTGVKSSDDRVRICPKKNASLYAEIPSRKKFDSYLNKIETFWGTRHDIGMLWAMRIMSPNWADFFGISKPRDWKSNSNRKYAILLSDGLSTNFMSAGEASKITTEKIVSNLKKTCKQLKKKHVEVITISYAFNLSDDKIDALEGCASPGKAYSAGTANIDELFKEIALDIMSDKATLTK